MRRTGWIVLIISLACTTLGSSSETVSIPVILQNGLTGSLDIQASTIGGPLESGDSKRWVNDLLDIRVSQSRVNGQRTVKVHIESPSGVFLGIDALQFRVFAPAARIDGVWTPAGRVSDDRLIAADPGVD